MQISNLYTAFAIASTAAAAPAPVAAPPTQSSVGFRLRIRLKDAAQDFTPSIRNNYLVINNGYPNDYDFLSINSGKHTRTWILNGTQAEVDAGQARIVDDYPDAVGSIYIAPETPLNSVRISKTNTATGVTLSPASDPVSYLLPDQYFVCKNDGEIRVRNIDPTQASLAPSTCVPVRLYPECHELFDGGADTTNAKTVRCYSLDTMPEH